MHTHLAVLRRQRPHLAGETSPQEAPLLIRAVGSTAHGTGLLACGSMRSGRLPEALASVAAGRTLPTHSCATAPDLNRLPATHEPIQLSHLCCGARNTPPLLRWPHLC